MRPIMPVAVLLIALAFLLPQGSSARELAAYTIEHPRGEKVLPWGLGPLAVLGERSAFPYHDGNDDWLYIQDRAGWESHIPLAAEMTPNDRANASYAFSSPDRFWIWSGVLGRATLREYRLRSADGAVLVRERAIGNKDTRPGGLIRLESGALVGVWHQFRYHPDRRLEVGILHVSSNGRVTIHAPINVPGREGDPVATRWALAQHPADGGIWAFFKRDSYHAISALRLTETPNGLQLDFIDPEFIGRGDGVHAPEGEFPYLAAAVDPERDRLLLAYQNADQKIFQAADGAGNLTAGFCPPPPTGRLEPHAFNKGARISIAEISSEGRRKFLSFPVYIERVRPFGLGADASSWLVFEPAACETHGHNGALEGGEVYASRYQGRWQSPDLLGKAEKIDNTLSSHIFYNPRRPQFVVRLADGRLYTVEQRDDSGRDATKGNPGNAALPRGSSRR